LLNQKNDKNIFYFYYKSYSKKATNQMSAIFVAMGASFLVAIIFLILYLFSVKKGQFEDTYTPSVRMLFDDEAPVEFEKENNSKQHNNSKENSNN